MLMTALLTAAWAAPLALPATAIPAPAADPLLRAQLARTYRAQRLEVLPELEFTPGQTSYYRDPWRFGPPRYYGYAPVTVIHTLPTMNHAWGIYQGGARVDVPTYLSITGQLTQRQSLDDELLTINRRSRIGYTIAGVGAAALVGGTVARGFADTQQSYEAAAWTSLAGVGLAVGGLIGGSASSGRSDTLRNRPSDYMNPNEVRSVAEDYNDVLAAELGLSPADRALIDSDRIPVRRKVR